MWLNRCVLDAPYLRIFVVLVYYSASCTVHAEDAEKRFVSDPRLFAGVGHGVSLGIVGFVALQKVKLPTLLLHGEI